MSSFSWNPLGGGGGGGVSSYASFAALPTGQADGTVAVTLDSDNLYVYNLALDTWILTSLINPMEDRWDLLSFKPAMTKGKLYLNSPSTVLTGLNGLTDLVQTSTNGNNFLYVLTNDGADGAITQFSIDSYGFLTNTGNVITVIGSGTTGDPVRMFKHPGGQFLYVVCHNDHFIHTFQVTATTGILAALANYSTATHPTSMVFKSTADYAYVTCGSVVRTYTVGTYALTVVHSESITADGIDLCIDPTDTHVYVIDGAGIQMYATAGVSGLTLLGSIAAGNSPMSITMSADGKNVYVANSGDNTISLYDRNTSTGILTAQTVPTMSVGITPVCIRVSPDDASVYVSTNNASVINELSRNATTGVLTPIVDLTLTGTLGAFACNGNGLVYALTDDVDGTITMLYRDQATMDATYTSLGAPGENGSSFVSNGLDYPPSWKILEVTPEANTSLSNLAAVALNTSLIPGSSYSTLTLGSHANPFQELHVHNLYNSAGVLGISAWSSLLADSAGQLSLAYSGRTLNNNSGTQVLQWATNLYVSTDISAANGVDLLLSTMPRTGSTNSTQASMKTGTVATGTSGSLNLATGDASGTAGTTGNVFINSGAAAGTGGNSGMFILGSGDTTTGNSGLVELVSGNCSGAGTSGSIGLVIGGTSGGSRGSISFSDGSEGTTGHVWTSKDTGGNGHWAAAYTNPMTAVGDLVVGTTAGAATRIAIGTSGTVLSSNGTTASWQNTPLYNISAVSSNTNVVFGITYACDVTSAGFNLQLPAPVNGAWFNYFDAKNTVSGSNMITLVRYGSEKINYASSNYTINKHQMISVFSDGTDWFVVTPAA